MNITTLKQGFFNSIFHVGAQRVPMVKELKNV